MEAHEKRFSCIKQWDAETTEYVGKDGISM
jgi:hypothetical protein